MKSAMLACVADVIYQGLVSSAAPPPRQASAMQVLNIKDSICIFLSICISSVVYKMFICLLPVIFVFIFSSRLTKMSLTYVLKEPNR